MPPPLELDEEDDEVELVEAVVVVSAAAAAPLLLPLDLLLKHPLNVAAKKRNMNANRILFNKLNLTLDSHFMLPALMFVTL